MESLSHDFIGANRVSDPVDRGLLLPEDWRMPQAAHASLLLRGIPRVNLLIIGVNGGVWNALEALLPDLAEPIATWSPGQRLVLPEVSKGTLILHEVGALAREDQARLVEWSVEAAGIMQIVSTTSAALLPRVNSGAFDDTLYYRLNTVCVDLTA